MKFVFFVHSLVSDWNHGNAHFLRGITTELLSRGHDVDVYEPANAWSVQNLIADHGTAPTDDFHRAYPMLRSKHCDDLDHALHDADVVLVHEWNEHDLVRRIGEHRARGGGYLLLFHDTHHRAATQPEQMAAYDLSNYDGVLAYGEVIRNLYLDRGWAKRAWTWHEAADTRVFYPRARRTEHGGQTHPPGSPVLRPLSSVDCADGDVVWIGNWGDEERTAELHEFFIDPVRELDLRARVYGVRYPPEAIAALRRAGIEYSGWLPNYRVPEVFANYRVTVHVPRRPYVESLPGIPTIRPFEALACGIPLLSAPWNDAEHLFTPGQDFLVARDGREMRHLLDAVLHDDVLARRLSQHGLETIRRRHTCAHRVDELLAIRNAVVSTAGPAASRRRGAETAPDQPAGTPAFRWE